MTRLDRLLSQLTRELADYSGTDDGATIRLVLVRASGELGLLAEIEADGNVQLIESAGQFSLDSLRASAASLRATTEQPTEATR